ncbi:MAG: hypothetical protein Q9169_007006, partial [Polycauliona sp. 2 TL-2023]
MSDLPDPSQLPSTTSLPSLEQLHISATPSQPPTLPGPPKSFQFFLLPPELRSRILSLLLCPTSHFTIDLSDENHYTSTQRLNYFLVSK